MKTILYMATTANGMIAKKNLETPWSEEELGSYCNKVKEIGNVVVGNRTYPQFREVDFENMGNSLMVVLTRSKSLVDKEKIKFANSAEQAMDIIKKAGFDKVLVTGGAETNKEFMKYVDEIYLDIEPLIFGEGVPLFSPFELELKLELIDTKMINKNTIQLHYKVCK